MKNNEISKGTDLNQETNKGNFYTEAQDTKYEDKKEDFMRHAHTADEEKTTNPDGIIRQTRASFRENTKVDKQYSNSGAPLEKKTEFAQLPIVLGWIGVILAFTMGLYTGASIISSVLGGYTIMTLIHLRKRQDVTWLKISLWSTIVCGAGIAFLTSLLGGLLIALTGILYMTVPSMKRI